MAVSSAGIGYLAVLHLDHGALFAPMSWHQLWIVVASVIGGMSTLFLSGDRLGQRGGKGALRALAGGIWITFFGALIGGTLALPVYGTMFGPFIVMVTFLGAPMLALLWVFNLLGIYLMMGTYQRERDSIFMHTHAPDIERPRTLR